MAPIDQDGQADAAPAAQVADRVQGRADGPAREQHVIHEHYFGSVNVKRDLGAAEHRPVVGLTQIVAVERDVDGSDVHGFAEQPFQF